MKEKMGRLFVIHLDEDGKIYSYKYCHLHLALSDHILFRVWKLRLDDRLLDIVDPELEGYPEGFLQFIKVALLCTQATSQRRPSMKQVIEMLLSNELISVNVTGGAGYFCTLFSCSGMDVIWVMEKKYISLADKGCPLVKCRKRAEKMKQAIIKTEEEEALVKRRLVAITRCMILSRDLWSVNVQNYSSISTSTSDDDEFQFNDLEDVVGMIKNIPNKPG